MKHLSIISLLAIGLSLAWAGFTPQVVDASVQLIGAGIPCGASCSGDKVDNCESRGCCDNANYSRCTGSGGPGTCWGDGFPCAGASYCYNIVSKHCW